MGEDGQVAGGGEVAQPLSAAPDLDRGVALGVVERPSQALETPGRTRHLRGVLPVVVDLQPAAAQDHLVGQARAQHARHVDGHRPRFVVGVHRGGQFEVGPATPEPARPILRLLLQGQADVGVRLLAHVPVDTAHELPAIERLRGVEGVVVAVVGIGVVGDRVHVEDGPAIGVEVRPEVVAGCGLARAREAAGDGHERRLGQVLALAKEELAEVALPLLQGGHHPEGRAGVDDLVLVLQADEEEELVAVLVEVGAGQEQGAREVEARVLIVALRPRHVGHRVRAIVGRHPPVAPVVVGRAVEGGRAALGHRGDLDGRVAELRRVVAGLDLHLVHHVGVHVHHHPAVAAGVDHVRTVHDRADGGAPGPVHARVEQVVRAPAETHGLEALLVVDYAGEDAQKLEGAAPDDGQVLDLVGRDGALASPRVVADDGALGLDGDGLGALAQVQPAGEVQAVARAQVEVLALPAGEAGHLHFRAVGARGEGHEDVLAPSVGDRGPRGLRALVDHSDACAGEQPRRFVGDRPAQGGVARALGVDRRRRHEPQDQRAACGRGPDPGAEGAKGPLGHESSTRLGFSLGKLPNRLTDRLEGNRDESRPGPFEGQGSLGPPPACGEWPGSKYALAS